MKIPKKLSIRFLLASAIAILIITCHPVSAQTWESLNPGAGGQVQDVVLDPHNENNAFVLSDVDGLYHTDDGGSRWQYRSRGLAGSNTLTLAYDPANANRIYLGTTVGLHTSSDGGESWQLHPEVGRRTNRGLLTKTDHTEELAIGSLLVNPDDSQQVIAGVGNKRDSTLQRAAIFRSTDSGSTFSVVRFGPASQSNKSILQLAYDPNQAVVFAALAEGGLWRGEQFGESGSWSQIASPAAGTGRVEGVAVAPDGTLYAVFGRKASIGTLLFASRDQGATWQALAGTGQPTSAEADFRNLMMDPRSSEAQHRLLVADSNQRTGLYEITIDWHRGVPQAKWDQVFWYDQRSTAPFETGWEGGLYGNMPRPLAYQYAPSTWSAPSLWVSGDQTLFKVDRTAEGKTNAWHNRWQQIYTSAPQSRFTDVPVNIAFTGDATTTVSQLDTYHSVGWQSTVDMDVSRYGNVIMRSGADHSVTLSWDNGQTWEDVSSPRRAKSQANAIVTQGDRVFLLAHYSGPFDFGASNTEGELWGASIDPENPQPVRWYFLAGGTGKYGDARGLASDVFTNIIADPSEPGRVYISTRGQGIYVIPDIAYLYDARLNDLSLDFYPRLPDSPSANEYEGSMVLDPNDSSVLYVADGNTLYKGIRDDSSSPRLQEQRWTWTPILSSEGLMTFDAWSQGGETVIAAATRKGDRSALQFSANAGNSWQRLVGVDELTAQREPLFDFSESNPIIFAVAGRGDRIYLSVQMQAPNNLGHGIYEVTLAKDRLDNIRDVTSNLLFPKSFRTKIITDPVTEQTHLYLASWGGGTWRLPLDAAP
ncbi:MAG: hypothetical protein AAF703_14625 [Cyanobacteria bacterium P01_D01_bin.105]